MRIAAIVRWIVVLILLAAAPAVVAAPATQPEAGGGATAVPASVPTAPVPASAPAALPVYHVVPAVHPAEAIIGSNTPAKKGSPADFRLQASITRWGAGVYKITLTDFKAEVQGSDPYAVLRTLKAGPFGSEIVMHPLALRSLTVDGQPVVIDAQATTIDAWTTNLAAAAWSLDPQTDPRSATYRLIIADNTGRPALELERTFSIEPDSYDLKLQQRLVNRTGKPVRVVWTQNLHGDIEPEDVNASGRTDYRKFEAGYYNLKLDQAREVIYTDNSQVPRLTLIQNLTDQKPPKPFWPAPKLPTSAPQGGPPYELEWIAATNRYFAVVAHAPVPPPATSAAPAANAPANPGSAPSTSPGVGGTGRQAASGTVPNPGAGANPGAPEIPPLIQQDSQIATEVYGLPAASKSDIDHRILVFTFTSVPVDVPAGGSKTWELGLFAGPLESNLLDKEPYRSLNFPVLVLYNMGGMCSFCTFQWLARALLVFLKVIHYLTFDWSVAIIILVLVVRLVLHPLTRRSQIAMAKMQKQMAAIQPEMEKIKKKFPDDKSKQQQEQMRLYREKGVNPAGMLGGCLPMFLQMPIWAALYAMLFFAIELWHQPAFYGVFQNISSHRWLFLADLSSPDNFITLGKGLTIPWIVGTFTLRSINIIPILMGLLFFFQQKFTTPPPANEQAAQQQKMMKYTTFIFPLMFYGMPSGLTLYIMASTAAGIVDSYVVKRHIKQQEEAGTLFQPKPTKPGGLMDRLQKMAEQQQRRLTGGDGPKKFKDRR